MKKGDLHKALVSCAENLNEKEYEHISKVMFQLLLGNTFDYEEYDGIGGHEFVEDSIRIFRKTRKIIHSRRRKITKNIKIEEESNILDLTKYREEMQEKLLKEIEDMTKK